MCVCVIVDTLATLVCVSVCLHTRSARVLRSCVCRFMPLINGCTLCGVRNFWSLSAAKNHYWYSSRHSVMSLIHNREHLCLASDLPVENFGSILAQFEHLSILGKHKCRICQFTVVTETDAITVESTVSALATHLVSSVHVNFQVRSDPWTPPLKVLFKLPPRTLSLTKHTFACYACEPLYTIHESFLDLCHHIGHNHVSSTCVKRAHDDWLTDNGDGMSRTCTLCDVVVWSDDDPHLTGKRHKKALSYLPRDALYNSEAIA